MHIPTANCPHRWCPALHRAMLVGALPGFVLTVLFGSVRDWLAIVVAGLFGLAVAMLCYGPGMRRLTARVTSDRLTLRPWWARVAALTDTFLVIGSISYTVSVLLAPEAVSTRSAPSLAAHLGTAFALGLAALNIVAHYRATAPAPAAEAGTESTETHAA